MLPTGDARLVQIVEAATADAARRAGAWLKCAPGCTQCCVGVFAISQLDAARLRAGWAALADSDPVRAAAIERRAQDAVTRLAPDFPGNARTGILDPDQEERFDRFGNEELCPVLDPETGLCGLYAARPITCRVFGPPLQTETGLGACELCFVGAQPAEIAAAEVHLNCDTLQSELIAEAEQHRGIAGNTLVAWALLAR